MINFWRVVFVIAKTNSVSEEKKKGGKMATISIENSPEQRLLIDDEKRWFQKHQWDNSQLTNAYAAVLRGIGDHVETLDRGNAERLVRYHAKKKAIEELVPDVQTITFV